MNNLLILRRRALYTCLCLVLFSQNAGAEIRELVILHTNDFHGHISAEFEYAGAAKIAAYVKATRKAHSGVLMLDAGDRISGTPVSTMYSGLPIYEVLNEVGYDAAVLGNHEFDHGYKQIEKFREIATFPLLAANAYAPDGHLIGDAPALITVVNGLKVGIIGLITEETPFIVTPEGNEGISFAPPLPILKAMVTALRPEVDVLILLSHLGHSVDKELAQAVEGIDVIVGGHSHTKVEPTVKVGDTYIVQAGFYGAYVGRIELHYDTEQARLVDFKGALIPAAELKVVDAGVERLVKSWEAKVSAIVDVDIVEATKEYDREALRPIFESVLAYAGDADFGFYNRGGIRDIIRKGPVQARQLWNVEPFGNRLAIVTAQGKVLKEIIGDNGLARSLEGSRVYRMATSNFVASQAEKVMPLKIKVEHRSILVRDLLINHLRQFGFTLKAAGSVRVKRAL